MRKINIFIALFNFAVLTILLSLQPTLFPNQRNMIVTSRKSLSAGRLGHCV
jgi:hypothetical protein